MTRVSLSVREGKRRKWSYESPLVSICEMEETDCREDTEPDGAECTTDPTDSPTDSIEVHKAYKLKKLKDPSNFYTK